MKTQVAKTGSKPAAAAFQTGNYSLVPPSQIIVDEKKNPREEYGNIEELMLSIIENGIRNPLKGYMKDGKVVLREGFRRMRAVKLALEKGKTVERVPVIIEDRPMSEEERTLEFLINNDGKPFTMLEQSEVVRRLLNFEWKVTDIVRKTGKARGYVENLIMLTKVPMKIQNYIKEGKISAHAVIQIMQAVKQNPEAAAKEVESAIQAAKESGKDKATPKHVATKKVKSQSFGKFYKWAEEIADMVAGRKDVISQRVEVLDKLMICFENGQSPKQVAETYFLDKSKKPAPITEKVKTRSRGFARRNVRKLIRAYIICISKGIC